MNPYTACGVWPDRAELVATVVDTEARLHRTAVAPLDDLACWGFLADLEDRHGRDLQLVLPEPLLRGHALALAARALHMTVLAAPAPLVEAIAAVAYSRAGPQRLATVLARLPGSPFHGHLRLLPRRDPRQMLLL